jgi:NADPH2:quinone reductase
MQAIYVEDYQAWPKLGYGELPDPEVKKGHVVVDVKYAGVNFPDMLIAKGLYQFKPDLPFSPGGEVAGVISAIGEGVQHLSVGDRVIGANSHGGFAEKVLLHAGSVYPIPEAIELKPASCLLETYATAIHALKDRANVREGERLLVLGAAGGTGIAAIQVGKAMGMEVIAACSTQEKIDLCLKNGADQGVNYAETELKEVLKSLGGVDVIFDPVGGDYAEAAFRGIRPGGRHLVIGFTAGKIPALPWNLPLLKQAAIVGVFWGGFWRVDPKGNYKNVMQLLQWMGEGKITPQITEELPLSEAATALQKIENREVKGKIVLKVS